MKKLPNNLEELLELAAAVSHGKKPAEAVAYALALWEEAERALDRLALEKLGIAEPLGSGDNWDRATNQLRYLKEVPLPEKSPATLDDFYRLIVRARTPDHEKRLRHFLQSQCPSGDALDFASKHLARLKREGFRKDEWRKFAGPYLDWWKATRAQINAANGGKPKKRP